MSSQYYKVTAYVGTPHRNAVEVTIPLVGPAGPAGSVGPVGPTGPQGVPGTGLEVLTTQGDLLYQGASTGQRLPIGTSGQVLKVANGIPSWGNESGAVTSVNGETGAVSLSAADVGAAAAAHTHDGTQVEIVADDATGPVLAAGFSEGSGVNGIYWPTDTTANALLVYKLNRTYGMFFEAGRWHIYELAPLSANIVVSSDLDDTDYPHQSNWPTGSVTKASLSNFGDNAAQQFRFVGDSMAVTDVTNAVSTSDSRLTDSRTPTSHAHGNLTNAGAIGTTANLPLKTGTNGVVEAGSFGTAAGSFCEGNDARLSDARTPSSTLAHKASHATGGTDALAPSDIGAQSLFTSSSITGATTLSAGRARIFDVSNFGSAYNIILPLTNSQNGDIVVFRATNLIAAFVSIIYEPSGSLPVTIGTITAVGQQYRFIYRSGPQDWVPVAVDTHTHAAADITSGTLDVARLPVGTGSTQVAAGNHTHVVADVTGAAASGSITSSGLTQATARILGRTTASTGSVEEIQIGSGLSLSAGELSSTVSAGIPATIVDAKGDLIVASAADTVARLPVGATNGHALVVDSAETLGMKWAAVSGVVSGSVDNAILRADGTGGSTSQSSAINIDDATTSTANNVAITNQHSGQTNSSLVLTPKGSGAIILGPKPDGTATGGNARGINSVDLTLYRVVGTQVASGSYSFNCGGQNTSSGTGSACFNFENQATNNSAFACNYQNQATAQMAFATGRGTQATATAAACFGDSAVASRVYTQAYAGGSFAAASDAQRTRGVLRNKVNSATLTELFLDGSAARFSVASGRTIGAVIHLVATTSGGEFACQYIRECVIRNRGGTTALRGSVQDVGVDTEDFASCDISIDADDTNDALRIRFQGTAPVTGCTITASTDRINKVAHGFNNNDDIIFSSLTGGAGLTANTVTYWVINANADDFQVSATRGGAAVNVTTDYSDATATRLFRVVASIDAVEIGHGT
jgi:hypothetical protein